MAWDFDKNELKCKIVDILEYILITGFVLEQDFHRTHVAHHVEPHFIAYIEDEMWFHNLITFGKKQNDFKG